MEPYSILGSLGINFNEVKGIHVNNYIAIWIYINNNKFASSL